MRSLTTLIGWALLATSAVVPGALAAERVALVIGNTAYRNAPALLNPGHDATAMAAALTRVGFEVDLRTDLDFREMQRALRDFGRAAETADAAVFYFAGHGLQVGSENYLVPIDAALERERDLLYEAMPLELVLDEVSLADKVGLVILDACRDNPLAESLRLALGPVRSRLVGRGLARVEQLPPDTMVAFSTAPESVAVDGSGQNSPYTKGLLTYIEEPGLELNLLFRKVREHVLEATAQRQDPRAFDALGAEPFFFVEPQPNQRPGLAEIAALELLDDAGPTPTTIQPPTDPDGDPLTVQVAGLPRHGAIQLGERALEIGELLSVAQLSEVTYTPSPGETGDAGSFDVVVRDDRGAMAIGRMPIVVRRSNQPPVVAALEALSLPAIPLGIAPPTDPDGDPLTVVVAEVPLVGAVKDGDQVVAVGDLLTPKALAGLVLEPTAAGSRGRFAFTVTDDRGASVTSAMALDLPGLGGQLPGPVDVAEPPAAVAAPVETAMLTPPVPETATPTSSTAAAVPEPETGGADRAIAALPRVEPQVAPFAADHETVRSSNLRGGPSTQTERVAVLAEGTLLQVIEQVPGREWFQVATADGQTGFIFGQLIRPRSGTTEVPAPAPAPLPTVQTPVDPAPPAAPAPEIQTAAVPALRVAGDALTDCPACPELVRIEAGSYVMGNDRGHPTERPARRVTISEPFALGRYEVTVGQFQACVDAGGCASRPSMRDVTDASPVHNLSWDDAQDYVAWLAETTGQPYRLPTEAEWEYAARAGTESTYWWGDRMAPDHANCEDCGEPWSRRTPAAVDTFPANPLGLHGMNGGVMEWVEDCWVQSHQDAPTDGSARTGHNCVQRVLRGGSWRHDATYASSASRLSYDASVRYYTNGLRVARDLD